MRAIFAKETTRAARPQVPRRLRIGIADLATMQSAANASGHPALAGGHAIYFSPATLRALQLDGQLAIYPDPVGLKILKNPGPPDRVGYLTDASHSSVRERVIGRLDRHPAAANYMWRHGLVPRIWDVVELNFDNATHSGLVVEHVAGTKTSKAQQDAFLDSLDRALANRIVDVAVEDWRTNYDFVGRGLEENLLARADRVTYVDTQNFFLASPQSWTRQIVDRDTATLHFGDERSGTRLLYQSIPGIAVRAKRDIDQRFQQYANELARLDVALDGRVVMDVGCNSGMMMYSALAVGATWAFGWDMPELAPVTRDLLLSLGMTRFDVTGRKMAADTPLRENIPGRFDDLMAESAIFYVAIHGHIGVNVDLFRGPWRVLVIEGHQGETEADRDRVLAQISEHAGELKVHRFTVEDADTRPRWAAIAVRQGPASSR